MFRNKIFWIFAILTIVLVCGLLFFKRDFIYLKKHNPASLDAWNKQDFIDLKKVALDNCQQLQKFYKNKEFPEKFGSLQQWKTFCNGLDSQKSVEQIKAYFEKLTLYSINQPFKKSLFTGYYSPRLNGSLVKTEKYSYPLYKRPKGLLEANMSDFFPDNEDFKYKKIFSQVKGNKIKPYYTRQQIEQDLVLSKKDVLLWVDDKVDAFFLHIQGSGEVELENGRIIHIGYAAQNGHPYYAIGRYLVDQQILTKDQVSLQSIKQYLSDNPQKVDEILNKNPSFIFFAKRKDGPYGAFGNILTQNHSVAIDRNFIPLGLPLFIDTKVTADDSEYQKMVFAQDVGGAINGAVRADIYFGDDKLAAQRSGKQNSEGKLYVFSAENF